MITVVFFEDVVHTEIDQFSRKGTRRDWNMSELIFESGIKAEAPEFEEI